MKVCVFLADGFEEIEGLTVVDILRRAGVDTVMMSVTGEKMIRGSHGISVEADCLFDGSEADGADMLVLPGGMPGTLTLQQHSGLNALLRSFDERGKNIAAICAAPSILGGLGMLRGRKACSYPSFEDKLEAQLFSRCLLSQTDTLLPAGEWALRFRCTQAYGDPSGREKAEEIRKAVVYDV